MQIQLTTRTKVLFTGIVTFFVLSFLLWEHFHGGVASHHILDQEELPAISNWWSSLWLPVLTWVLLSRIEKRLREQSPQTNQVANLKKKNLWLFGFGIGLGILIAVSFTNEYSLFLDNVLFLILLLSLLIPIYYAEFILGFVLGMTYTFGALLPTFFILVMALVGVLIYKLIRPLIMKLIKRLRRSPAKSPNR
jgi:hypothetical protein